MIVITLEKFGRTFRTIVCQKAQAIAMAHCLPESLGHQNITSGFSFNRFPSFSNVFLATSVRFLLGKENRQRPRKFLTAKYEAIGKVKRLTHMLAVKMDECVIPFYLLKASSLLIINGTHT